jgi:hypothetical protein
MGSDKPVSRQHHGQQHSLSSSFPFSSLTLKHSARDTFFEGKVSHHLVLSPMSANLVGLFVHSTPAAEILFPDGYFKFLHRWPVKLLRLLASCGRLASARRARPGQSRIGSSTVAATWPFGDVWTNHADPKAISAHVHNLSSLWGYQTCMKQGSSLGYQFRVEKIWNST